MSRLISIVVALLIAASTTSFSAPKEKETLKEEDLGRTKLKKYRILSTVGRVTAWEPYSTGWVEVNPGMELWESTLVQIHLGGTFSFEQAVGDSLKGVQGQAIQVKLGTPIVVRLNEDITRQIELGSYFIPNLPKNAMNPDEGSRNPIYQTISEAWQRFAAIATINGMPLKDMMPGMNEKESSLALRAKKLNLLAPVNGSTILVKKVPTEIRLMWEPVPEPNTTYELRLWRIDHVRPGPHALTQIDNHYLMVPREGSYYVQVTTADGKYQSEPHLIFVSLPIAGRIAKQTNTVGLASLPIPLLLPPDDFIHLGKSFPVSMAFEWDLSIEDEVEPTFKFKVTDMAGKTLVETPVAGRRFVARFGRPGKFKWSVSAVIPPSLGAKTDKIIQSETHEFEIRALNDPKIDPIADALFGNKSAVLYLENGFDRQ